MLAENVSDMIRSLTPEQQDAVREFIHFLKSKEQSGSSPFLKAVDEFIHEHPHLLRRLAE